ncbi:type IV pili methyl-accepting chemotaxis transducer N-terminal domain-containing protein [Algibacillus agarilyticus]|uniref:type IV pili methyl-accepting chemotaxis transducer N-terminal domain-containing protein n=1 Tax=Algibacillus agarilyticus TaxID=2234133 RepID=UPI000DCFB3BE|nr:type IV pili methyl-accepting chemotaxis transducer N-terminal domain-containing protein [Algibacillus agarilyticus]
MLVKKIFIIAALFISFFPLAHSQELSLSEAINQAGLQRMLSQRMAKNYILISQKLNVKTSAMELDESAATFEENLFNLSGSATTSESKNAFKKLKKSWYRFRSIVLAEVNDSNTVNVVEYSTELLKSAHAFVLTLEQTSSKNADKLINISGRQRMLSQRLAMLYFASHSGYNESQFKQEMQNTAGQFTDALSILQKAKENTDSINDALAEVLNQWDFYKTKFNVSSNAPFSPKTIKVITESMLKDMNSITKQYEIVSINEIIGIIKSEKKESFLDLFN